jgi:tetratricopeptide (TPR) repeat protein
MLRRLSVMLLMSAFSYAAFAQSSKSATDYYNEGERFLDDKKYTEAFTAFKSAVTKNSSYKEALYQAGWCANELEKFDDAIYYLQRAKNLDASNQKIYFELGYAYKHLNKTEDAIVNFKKTLQLSPDYEEASLNIASIYYDKADYENALTYYEKYLQDEDADDFYYYRAGWCANDLGRYEQAINYLSKYYPEEAEDRAKKFAEIGYANFKLENADEAITAYKRALNEKPGYGTALRGLGDTYDELLQQNTDALNYYEMAVQKDPDNSKRCYYKLGWLYNDEGRYSEAVSTLLKAVDYKSNDADNRVELGFAYYKLGKFDEALSQLKTAVQLDNRSKYGYYYQGLIYLDQNQKAKAKEVYEKLKAIDPDQAKKLLDKYNDLK